MAGVWFGVAIHERS